MKPIITFITIVFCLVFITACNSGYSDKEIYKKAVIISQKLDNNSMQPFREWSCGRRGKFDIWSRIKVNDSVGYALFYYKANDTDFIKLSSVANFRNDFHSTYSFDIGQYWSYSFAAVKQNIVRIISVDNHGKDHITDTLIATNRVFPNLNPFTIIDSLTKLKNSLQIVGSTYIPRIGNFVEFWLSWNYKLVYLPDDLKIDDKCASYWMKYFSTGKVINKNWTLIKEEHH